MWELGNRSIIALVSALSVCVIIYNVWGPILVLTVSLVLTIYACYFLIINDSLLSRHAFVLFDYCKQVSSSVHAGIDTVAGHTRRHVRRLVEAAKRGFRRLHLTQNQPGMERRRGSHYQLSSEFYLAGRNSGDFAGSISQFSPIRRNSQSAHTPSDITPRSKIWHKPTGRELCDHNSFATKHTSTPMYSSSKEEIENQTINLFPTNRPLSRRTTAHDVYYKEESPTYFTNNDSLWGTTVSPKQGMKGTERKTVQTVAGPLLASTRYNIDAKVYNDVHSPGLTTRLTKYAMEANSKLTHQPQYRVGQFPKVNLNASPVPLINPKSVKTRTPMTVRVAPPNSIRYSPPSQQNKLSNVHHLDNSSLPSSVAHLRDISLKRHASRDDVSELTKKQRTDGLVRKEVEPQDEMKQKRSRDDSTRSDEDSSPQSQSTRPTKRTKTPSCYDIINSFSSSRHVVVSGVKRKARDFSRSGTPDFEKHFKSLEHSPDIQTLPQISHVSPRRPKIPNQEKESNFVDNNKKPKYSPLKGILKSSNAIEHAISAKRLNIQKDEKDRPKEQPTPVESARLTHKLFMRAEPERNEKLRMLVEEQGNVRAKFTTDDVEEIKREDIADMRQTSMKARLKSMFDAISGKAASRINPDVVIQAEDVNAAEAEPDQPAASPEVPCATLNSSTTTTNINTTPISTSVIAINPGASESVVKHVAFTLPTKETPNTNSVQFSAGTVQKKDETIPTSLISKTTNVTSPIVFTTTESKPVILSKPVTPITSTVTVSVPNFEFGKSIPAKSTSDSLPISTSNTNTPLLAPSTTASIFKNVTPAATPIVSTTLVSSPIANVRNEAIQSNIKMNVSQSEGFVSTSLNTPVGSNTNISMSTPSNPLKQDVLPLTAMGKEQNTSSPFTIGVASTTSPSVSSVATTTISSSTPLFTFGNKTNSPSTFVFGTNTGNAPQTSGTFGTPIFQASTAATTTTTTAPNSLQSIPVATVATFESNTKTTTRTTANPTFSFRPATTTSDNKINFSFGNATTTNANVKTGVSNTGLFTMGNNNPIPCFGTPSTTSAPVQFASSTSSIFANTSSPATPLFGTATTVNQPIFNAPSSLSSTTSAFAVPKISTPVFGSSAATTTTGFASTSAMPVFSNPNNETSSTTTSTASMPVFGSNASTSSSTSGATNLFSAPTSAPSTTATNIFGQTSSTMTNFKSTTGVFGNNTGSSVFGSPATTTATFGTPATTTATFGTPTVASNPVISTPVSTSAFGSTSIPASTASIPTFGATSTVASGFRTQNQSKPGPSSASQNFGSSIFGSENTGAHIFGTSNGAASPFSSASTSNATNPTFGAASTSGSSAFGDANKVPPFGGQPSAFGASTTTPAPSVFGNASNATSENNNASSGIFSFGASQKPAQPTTSFSFGSNNNTSNNATASTSAPFQFGTPNTGAGFNFTAPSTTPSINFGASSSTGTFNASAPGMFSIGSGSTAPRSRNARARKLR